MKETPEARSRIMRAVKGRDMAPEMVVRRLARGMGYRFRYVGGIRPAARIWCFQGCGKSYLSTGVSGTATIAREGRASPQKTEITGLRKQRGTAPATRRTSQRWRRRVGGRLLFGSAVFATRTD